jgi:hypothetical protein
MKALIRNRLNGRKFLIEREDLNELNEFINYQKSKKDCPWGKLEREVEILQAETPPPYSTALETKDVIDETSGNTFTYVTYRLEQDFEIEFIDDSEEKEQLELEKKAKNDFKFCEDFKYKIHARNSKKTLSYTDLLNMEEKYQHIENLINRAAVKSLKVQLEITETDFKMFTEEDKNYYLSLVEDYLNA